MAEPHQRTSLNQIASHSITYILMQKHTLKVRALQNVFLVNILFKILFIKQTFLHIFFHLDDLSFNISVDKCQQPPADKGTTYLSTDQSSVTEVDTELSTGQSSITVDGSELPNDQSSVTVSGTKLSTDQLLITVGRTVLPTEQSSVTVGHTELSTFKTDQTNPQCECPCRSLQQNPWSYIYSMNLTLEEIRAELNEELEMLKERIHIDPKKTGRYNSTKTSATDNRWSSRVTGCIGGLVLLIVVGILVMFDVIRFCQSYNVKKRIVRL